MPACNLNTVWNNDAKLAMWLCHANCFSRLMAHLRNVCLALCVAVQTGILISAGI